MAYPINPLHKKIGDILTAFLKDRKDVAFLKDQACGGNQHIPLFCTLTKSRETEFCNVDLMILKNNKIKVIIEIEESNVKPTQVCGKFLTSALSRFYIHESHNYKPIEMDQSVTFIQIVDSSKLESKTRKFGQWHLLEKSIRSIIPLKDSSIRKYSLLFASETDFELDSPTSTRLVSEITEVLLD